MTETQTRRFEAEVAQVLHLVTHSLYSHKEIFLREIISNASDACDKLRFAAIADPALLEGGAELAIEVSYDKDARTLTVRDNGIGMSADEVVENIGTIARSGTRRFLETLSGDQRKDTQLIGQFGVGFYSAFIVADRVVLSTRKAGSDAGVRWESTGTDSYTLADAADLPRGTTVTLHLKDGEDEFLADWRLKSLIAKYSDHIGFPIRMPKEDDRTQWETVNHAAALWTRPKSEIKDEEYQAFYRHVGHDYQDALTWTHNRVEGNQSYTLLLYVPKSAGMDALFSGRDEQRKGLKLYIRRVFIMDAAEQLMPNYLRFVRGVVDSDDLPLNVSREILQENRLVSQIRSACVKRSLDALDKLVADRADDYASFWKEFGNVLKEGLGEDHANRERIAKLLRFASTREDKPEQTVSLDDYIARMGEGQDTIWYLTADTWPAARHSPQLEALRARGIEVLLMYDRIDEWAMGYLHEYAGKKLKNVAKGDIDLGPLTNSADQAAHDEAAKAAEPLVAALKTALGERVRDVRVSRRLTDSASCLVVGEQDMAQHMQRLLRQAGHDVPVAAPVLEINPGHALVRRFESAAGETRDDLALLLLEQAQLADGGTLEDPASFVRRVNRLLAA